MKRSRTRHAQVPEWAFLHSAMQKPATTLHVYTALCTLANYSDRVSDADWEKLAEYTSLGRTVIYGAIKILKDAGIIIPQEGDFYWLPFDDPSATADSQSVSADDLSATADGTIYTRDIPESGASKKIEYQPEAQELCDLLADKIENHLGRRPRQSRSWLVDMDRLLRLGSPSWETPEPIAAEKIARLVNALFAKLTVKGRDNFCWADNIQSPNKLRTHWDRLCLALNEIRPGGSNGTTPVATVELPTPENYAAMVALAESGESWHDLKGNKWQAKDHPMYHYPEMVV